MIARVQTYRRGRTGSLRYTLAILNAIGERDARQAELDAAELPAELQLTPRQLADALSEVE